MIYSIFNLITSILILSLGWIVFKKNKESIVNITFGAFSLVLFVWLFAYFIAYNCKTYNWTIFWFKIGYIGVISIPIIWYHFVLSFLNKKGHGLFLKVGYLVAAVFAMLVLFTPYFFTDLYSYYWGYYPKVSVIVHPLFLLYFNTFFTVSILLLFFSFWRKKKEITASLLIRRKYVFWSTLIGTIAACDFVPNYGIEIYPFGFIPMLGFFFITAYAIYKYRLMDVRIAFSRVGIFAFVYSLVLGIPFALGSWGRDYFSTRLGMHWWLIPTGVSTILATIGPFIYIFLQNKAEDRLLKEERGDKQFLMQASAGMTRIRSLKKLLGLIDHILSQRLKVSNVGIYLLDPETNQYVLKASRLKYKNPISIKIEDPLIQWLKEDNSPLVYEETKMRVDMENNNQSLKEIKSQMEGLSASVIIPAVMQDHILGFLVLGERKSRRMYTTDLLNALSVLSNQAALAIENAIFYEETGKTLAQQFQESRLKSLGKFSGGIAHQVRNTLNAITIGGGFLKEMLLAYDFKNLSLEKLEEFKNKFITEIDKMVARAEHGAEVTEAIRNYAKADKAPTTPSVTSFKKVIFDCKELALLKHKDDKLVFELTEDYPKDIILWVNFSTFQDAIFNALDNSCDAMVSKRDLIECGRLNIKDYNPQIIIRGQVNNAMFEFEIEDNGIGMTEEQLKHGIGTPLFTTKGKGTGLGVSMMYQFIRQNKGDIRVESQYEKWTKIIISLPLATKEQIEQSKENKDGD